MSDYEVSAELSLHDNNLSSKVNSVKKSLGDMQKASNAASSAIDKTGCALEKTGSSAVNAAAKLGKVKASMDGLDKKKDITVGLKDNASSGLEKLQAKINGIGERISNARVSLQDNASAKVNHIKEQLNSLNNKAYTAIVNIKENGAMGKLKSGAAGIADGLLMNTGMQMAGAAGIGMGIYDTIKTATDFQAEMSKVKAIATTGMDSAEANAAMEQLTAKAKEMGATTQFSASESAKALEYMAMAGWKTNEMLDGISGVMDLAAASGEDLGRVSDIVTDALTAFGLKASDSGHFADVLAAASSNSNTNVSMMGMTFKYVAPIAGALKYSIEDVGTAIGLMANAGIKGEQAGTSLRAVITRLIDPPKTAGSMLDRLAATTGIAVNEMKTADGKVKPFRQTMLELRAAFAGLNDAEKAEAASAIAGQEAMSGFLAIVNASDEDFNKLAASIDGAEGSAASMAKTMNDNLKGDLKALGSVWESVQLSFMEGKGSEGLRSFVQGVKSDLEKLGGYLKDGFDITDVGKIALDIVVQLKNKFLELDGVGSILAGGALAAGLYKIISLSKKAIGGLKDLAKSPAGKTSGIPGVGGNSVGEMIVHAGTVIVNGKAAGGASAAGGAAAGGAEARKAGGKAGTPKAGGRGWGGLAEGATKGLGKLALPLAFLDAGLNIYETYGINEQASAEAQYGIDSATNSEELEAAREYQQKTEEYNQARMGESVGSGTGMIAGGIAGAEAGAAAGGAIGALFGGVGAAPGAAIGGLLGGIGGAIAGSDLGGMIGSALASFDYSGMVAKVGEGIDAAGKVVSDTWDGVSKSVSDTWDGVSKSVSDTWNNETTYLSNQASAVAKFIGSTFDSGLKTVSDTFDSVGSWFSDKVFTPVKNVGNTMLNFMIGLAALAWEGIEPYFSAAADWFSNTVWQPIAETATNAWNTITEAVNTAWDAISTTATEVWDGITQTISDAWDIVTNTVADAWGVVTNVATDAWNTITSIASDAWSGVTSLWANVTDWFSSAVWQPLSAFAMNAWDSIKQVAADAWTGVTTAWGIAASWFEGTVWAPIKSGVDNVYTAITNAFSNALNVVKNTWNGLANWFESTVIGPIRDKFNSIVEKGASVRASMGFASGTSWAPGGWTEINEHGGEIVDLPEGSRVYPHATTMSIIREEAREGSRDLMNSFAEMGGDSGMQAQMPSVQMINMPEIPEMPKMPGMPEMPAPTVNVQSGGNGQQAGAQVTISGNTFSVREEADINRIAYEILKLMQMGSDNFGGEMA